MHNLPLNDKLDKILRMCQHTGDYSKQTCCLHFRFVDQKFDPDFTPIEVSVKKQHQLLCFVFSTATPVH